MTLVEAPAVTGAEQVETPQQRTMFKPGQSGNPKGRPVGARSKLGEQFLKAMQEDFEANGVVAIQKVRQEKPEQYLKVIASILPKEVKVSASAVDELDDDELASLLLALRSVAGKVAALEAGEREGEAGQPESAP